MFKAKQASGMACVPPKLMSIKPEAQVNCEPGSQAQARFLMPQHLGFLGPRGGVLKYNLQMRGRGYSRPGPRAGVHSLWRNYWLQGGAAQAALEECGAEGRHVGREVGRGALARAGGAQGGSGLLEDGHADGEHKVQLLDHRANGASMRATYGLRLP